MGLTLAFTKRKKTVVATDDIKPGHTVIVTRDNPRRNLRAKERGEIVHKAEGVRGWVVKFGTRRLVIYQHEVRSTYRSLVYV